MAMWTTSDWYVWREESGKAIGAEATGSGFVWCWIVMDANSKDCMCTTWVKTMSEKCLGHLSVCSSVVGTSNLSMKDGSTSIHPYKISRGC